ncbi:hypothetical protein BJV78DRAFT_1150858 [Lactifluus subvellereus]|nr:hypothetical protein BJV78DRAFT_1150858 [Lactifluus subvellereus]
MGPVPGSDFHQRTNSTTEDISMVDSDLDSDSGSTDANTVSRHTPCQGPLDPPSEYQMLKRGREEQGENRREDSIASSKTTQASLAPIAEQRKKMSKLPASAGGGVYKQVIAQLQQEGVDRFVAIEESDSEPNYDYAPTEISESTQGRWSPAT